VGHVVWGTVTESTGTPLTATTSTWVRFVNAAGAVEVAHPDSEGTYSMSGLAEERWYLTAYALGHHTQDTAIDLNGAVSVRQDFVLAPQPSVRVKLLAPDGRPFWEVARELGLQRFAWEMVAVATREPPQSSFHGVSGSLNNRFGVGSMWTNGQGDVKLPLEYWGRIDLQVDPPVHVSVLLHHDVIETKLVSSGQDEVSFSLDPADLPLRLGGVELRVVDAATGSPLVAEVSLDGDSASGGNEVTDANGALRLEGRTPGLHKLSVAAPGKGLLRLEVDVPRGGVANLGTVALENATPVRGVVVDEQDRGLVAEVQVVALPKPGETLGSNSLGNSSRSDGSFEIAALPPGLWLLQAKDRKDGRLQGNAAELMSPNVLVDTRQGPVDDLRVKVVRVSRVSVSWSGDDRDDLRLRFFDEQGFLRQTGGFFTAAPVQIDLLPGTWRLAVVDSSGEIRAKRSFTLGKETLVLELGPDR
jgi:hypothetical protein